MCRALVRLGAVLLVGVCAFAARAADSRPNVLLVMPDDVSFGDFSFYNPDGPRTPHIDRLARQSVRLTDFHVSPTCSPTRAALMTGRYNNATGVWHTILGRYFLRRDEVTMADVFRANGYRTGLFGKWHLGDNFPYRPKDRGFDHVAILRGGGIDQQHNPWGNTNNVPSTLFVDDRPVVLADEDDGIPGAFVTNFITGRAIEYMDGCARQNQPFLAYVAYNAVHLPHDMPPDARPGISAAVATTENMDKNVGRLLAFLEERRLAANTIVVFLTDNGSANARQRGDKATHYEGGHAVPCFVRWPAGGWGGGEADGREVDRLVSHIDLLPTFMEVLGLRDVASRPAQVPLHGRSIRLLLDRDPANDPAPLRDRILIVDNQRMDPLVQYRQAAVMQDELAGSDRVARKWRLLREAAEKPWELYDLVADPRQQANLAGRPEVARVVERLSAAYEPWWREVSARAGEYSREIIGAAEQPEVCLYAHDWHMDGFPPWNHGMIAAGLRVNGFHAVEFAAAGAYRFDLRRWPREIEATTALGSALAQPVVHPMRGRPALGEPLAIASGRLRIWHGPQVLVDARQRAGADADGLVFAPVELPAGPAMVQTWFYDAAGNELCGAYYTYVAPAAAGPPGARKNAGGSRRR